MRPNFSHVSARLELMTLIQMLRLPLDERAQQRVALHAKWAAARRKPVELHDVVGE
jgi:chromosome partitioning protein